MGRSKIICQPSPRVLAAKENGRKGGLVTATRHGVEFLSKRGESGGQAVRDRYGRDFYKHIGQLRKVSKGWPKGKPRKAVQIPDLSVV